MAFKQIDCFKLNISYWKFLAIWPENNSSYYKYYTKLFIVFFVLTYNVLFTINFYFLPRQLDLFIEEMLFYFTELAILSKVLTLLFMRDKTKLILDLLESDIFQPDADDALNIIVNAKIFVKRYWKIIAFVSYTSNLTHVLSPVVAHLFSHAELELPICSYSFLPDNIREMLLYPLYFYQSIGMHFHMLYNVNNDSFFNGLLILTIAQLEVLDLKLRRLTNCKTTILEKIHNDRERERIFISELSDCIIHFVEIEKLRSLIEEMFSYTLFVQFCMSSCIICVCLFRFTLPAPSSYYVFLTTYMTVMVVQIMVPCWFGSRIIETSSSLSVAVYNCDWTPRTQPFKSNLRFFVERMNKPLAITGWKMFSLSLATFTKIINMAYSFFALLRHMQSRES